MLILMLTFLPPFSGTADGAPDVNMVEVTIAEDSIPFDVSFNGSGSGTFHCSATLLLNMGIVTDSVDVLLTVERSEHISAVLSEYNFTLTPDDPVMEFTAEVTLLTGTSSSLHPILTIGGSAESQPTRTKGEVVEASASVEILPFYGAEITFVESFGKVDQGGSSTFALNIRNTGNSRENFIFILTNRDELRSRGISVSIEEESIALEEGGSKDITIKVKADRDASRGGVTVLLEVYSENKGPGSREPSTGVLTLTVENAGIGAVLDWFSSPIYLWGSLLFLIAILGALVYGGLKLRENIRWKRAVQRMRAPTEVEEDPPPPTGPFS